MAAAAAAREAALGTSSKASDKDAVGVPCPPTGTQFSSDLLGRSAGTGAKGGFDNVSQLRNAYAPSMHAFAQSGLKFSGNPKAF